MLIKPRFLVYLVRSNAVGKLKDGRGLCTSALKIARPSSTRLFHNAGLHCGICKCSIFPNHEQHESVDTDMPNYGQPMEAWYYDVNKDGCLRLRSGMNVHVQPLNPQKHPQMNKLFINIMYMGKDRLSSSELVALTKSYIVNVDLDDTNKEMEISIKEKARIDVQALVHVQVPIKYNIEVSCSKNGEVSLAQLEAEKLKVRTHQGNIIFKSIKSINVDVSTNSGNVHSQSLLQGNAKIVCRGNGGINAGRIQGQTVHCESQHGDIKVKAIYADSSQFSSDNGNIHLGSCHGNTKVNLSNGNLFIDSLDGNLKGHVEDGHTQLALSREGSVQLNTENGDISLRVPESLNSSVDLTASEIDQGEVTLYNSELSTEGALNELKGNLSKNKEESTIEASTKNGKIQLLHYDWFSSLNIGKDSAT
ncbi:hypothetical protein ACF0H5_014301 [Mactra antiquata]